MLEYCPHILTQQDNGTSYVPYSYVRVNTDILSDTTWLYPNLPAVIPSLISYTITNIITVRSYHHHISFFSAFVDTWSWRWASVSVAQWLTDLSMASKMMVCWYAVLRCEMHPDYHLYPYGMLPVRHGWILSQLISAGYSQTPCKSVVSFLFTSWMSASLSLMQLRRAEYMYTHRPLY